MHDYFRDINEFLMLNVYNILFVFCEFKKLLLTKLKKWAKWNQNCFDFMIFLIASNNVEISNYLYTVKTCLCFSHWMACNWYFC